MIRQGFSLDRLGPRSYIGACILLAACARPPAPLVPVALAPVALDSAAAWARSTIPAARRAIRFRWRYRDERVSYAGRGMARIAAPDSLRFDYAGPLGLGAGAAVVIGDSVSWADPAENFHELVPAIPMLWAALGMVRPPSPEGSAFSRADSADGRGSRRFWRFVHGPDTLDYLASQGATLALQAEWRQGGVVRARSRTVFGQNAMPASARIDFPEGPARFEVTVVGIDTLAGIPPALWRARR